ncbi:hypothetical protein [Sediminicurvatus halobius]|uniref:DUF1097 domain-containing protein n=1 Tax=Sediminicurvatus halobius TaxID=2182432 RepID=A0A2U2MYM8_9GAMM|nr:hypothetical protein [Spiribacter halobius]PWG61903.1 hypothetical protein DEM34_14335 [Spiribacter halobius]UEX79222.1 hypothetical protein LMH63_06185 [Spiribacter halobius]
MEWLVKTVLAAAISFLVPWLLKRLLPASGADPRSTGPATTAGKGFPWLAWIGALALAGGLSGIISGAMGLILGGVANWSVLGATLGIVQWYFLSRRFDVGPWFALASCLGWATFVFLQPLGHPTWAVVGLLVGLLQWLGLPRGMTGALWWIPASALAWFAGGMTGLGVGMMVAGASHFAIGWIVGWTCVGAVGAAVLALPLSRMWRGDARDGLGAASES